jgi:hypothetical protein
MAALRGRRVAGACFDVPERSGEDPWALPGSDRPPIVLSVVVTSRNRHESKREMHISLNRGVNHSISENRQERDLIAAPVTTGTRARRPEPEPWADRGLSAQVLGKLQIQNSKEVFWDIVFCRSAHMPIIQRRKAGNQPLGVNQYQGRPSESISRAAC